MIRKGAHIVLIAFVAVLLSSCSIEKFVPKDHYFLDKNIVVIEEKDVEFKKSDVSSYIIQKTHPVRFPFKFSTWLYYVTENKTDKGFWRWVNQKLANTPEYYDEVSAHQSAQQIAQYLDNRGYFNSKVTHNVTYDQYKAKATYTITPAKPYYISQINYNIEDSTLSRYVMRLEDYFPVKKNEIYNSYKMDEQRTYLTERIRNVGYYFFTRDYITFEVDSNFNDHTLAVTMVISNPKDPKTNTYHPHKQYYINKINIYPNYTPIRAMMLPTDSTTITVSTGFRNARNTLNFYYNERPIVKPSAFAQIIQIQKGRLYRLRQVSLTYSALSSLKIFTNSSIEFDTVPSNNDTLNLLNCNIMLRRSEINTLKFQTEGTNSGGDLGINGSVTYTNRNIFHGAEVLTISLKGGLEAQKVLDLEGLEDNGVFNTREVVFNSSIFFPRFLSPIPLKVFAREYQPRTTFSLGFSYQGRYAYSRYIATSSFGYDWKSSQRMQYILTPIYLNFVKINPIPEFQALLDQESNQRIKDQYTNHLLFGGRYSFVYSTQNVNRNNHYIFLRGNLESSGFLLSLLNKTAIISEHDDHYELFGIRYAQYVRGDIDFRQYITTAPKTWIVFREFLGVGIPYGNSYDMPFERSFYSGGSMGMRGWSYRKLGPGAYQPEEGDIANIERIGDIQMEINAEMRFPIYSIFNGAVFVDVGNIWNYHPNELLPKGEFRFDSFYKQLAVDAGIGLRLDVKMAILRLDIAVPIRNPYPNKSGSYWRFTEDFFNDLRDVHFNINIGYPF